MTTCSSQAEAVEGAEAVLTMVPKGAHAREVFLDAGGVLEHVAPGTVLVDCSTIDMNTALDRKMINNMLLFINLAGVGKGVALAERLDVDLRVLYDVVSSSSGDSWPLRKWFPVLGVVETAPANHGFEASFPAEGAVKDVGLAVAAADRFDLPVSMARKAEEMYQALTAPATATWTAPPSSRWRTERSPDPSPTLLSLP